MGIETGLTRYTCDRCKKTLLITPNEPQPFDWINRTYTNSSQENKTVTLCPDCYKAYNEQIPRLDALWDKFITRDGKSLPSVTESPLVES